MPDALVGRKLVQHLSWRSICITFEFEEPFQARVRGCDKVGESENKNL